MKRTLAALAVLAGLLVAMIAAPAATASHFQGCNPIAPIAAIGLPIPKDCPPPPPDDEPLELSGCAYGAFADVTQPLTGANAVLNNVAPVNFTTLAGTSAAPALMAPCPMFGPVLPPLTNFVASATLPVGVSPVGVSSNTLFTSTEGLPGYFGPMSYSLSSAETEKLSVTFPGAGLTITADVVRAVAYCTALAGPLGRNDVGPPGYGAATLVNLSIVKTSAPALAITIPVLPAEDTWISIPGVGGVMLRETWDLESPPWPMNSYKSFTENMIHVYFTNPALLVGDVVISHAHCDGYKLVGQPQGGHQPPPQH